MDKEVIPIKRFYIENLGCAKNQVDAEIMINSLEEAGYVYSQDPESADVIIVNSCSFIKSAQTETVETTFSFLDQYAGAKVVLAGCFAQRYGGQLQKMLPEVAGIFGNKAPAAIDKMMPGVIEGKRPLYMPEALTEEERESAGRKVLLSPSGSAYIKIAEGCNNRCSYCAIPLIRGNLKSRQLEDVVQEIEGLLKNGVHEIILIGQDLSAYGKDKKDLSLHKLLQAISALDGQFWVRLLYIHPDHFPLEILPLFRLDRRFLPYFDIPFQHASQRILRRMGRKGNMAQYLKLINTIRETVPAAVIRSTFMVGFPGETRKDFKELLSFQQQAELEWLGIFEYSREEETPAYKFRGKWKTLLAGPVMKRRRKILESRQTEIVPKRLRRFLNQELEVLLEEEIPVAAHVQEDETGEEKLPLALGRAYMQAPEVDGLMVLHPNLVGQRDGTLTPKEDLIPGKRVLARVLKINGIDMEAQIIKAL